MTMTPHPRHPDRGERGATLIMAVVFVFVVAISLVAVGGLAANALLHTSNVRAQRTSNEDAATAVTTAMQYLRYNPAPPATPWPPNPSTLLTCLPRVAPSRPPIIPGPLPLTPCRSPVP